MRGQGVTDDRGHSVNTDASGWAPIPLRLRASRSRLSPTGPRLGAMLAHDSTPPRTCTT